MYKEFEKSPELFCWHFIILLGVAKDFCGFVVKEKFLVFGADAFKGVNRKAFVENVFKAKENYITFGERFVILTGTKVSDVKHALIIPRPKRKIIVSDDLHFNVEHSVTFIFYKNIEADSF